jgi:hypothetical protein
MIAGMCGFRPDATYFESEKEAKAAPKVDFGTDK